MFNFKSSKMSKFVTQLMNRLSEEKDNQKIAERAFSKATNKVAAQVASLKYKRVDLEDKLDDATDKLAAATYNSNFDLNVYDRTKSNVVAIEEEIADIDRTIEERNALLEGWK